MGYTFTCDGPCGEHRDELPAFIVEIRESWFETTTQGGVLADMGYSPEPTSTSPPAPTNSVPG